MLQANQRLYFTQDANWDTTAIVGYNATSGTWSVVQRYVYSPYGTLAILNADFTATPTGTVPLVNNLFQGMANDPVTGLYYERARWYSTSLGTWISQDPAQYINGADTYQFVMSDPVSLVDASGLYAPGPGLDTMPVDPGTGLPRISPDGIATDTGVGTEIGTETEVGAGASDAWLGASALGGVAVGGLAVDGYAYYQSQQDLNDISGDYGYVNAMNNLIAERDIALLDTGDYKIGPGGTLHRKGPLAQPQDQAPAPGGARGSGCQNPPTNAGGGGQRPPGGKAVAAPGDEGPQRPKTLQTGGNTIKPRTATDLGMSRQEASDAMHALKQDNLLPNNYHQTQILNNGDVIDSNTGEYYGNLYDYAN